MTPNENQNTEEIIKELCMGNGLCFEKIEQEGPKTAVLEMFFSGYPGMVGLSFFPNLTSLILVGQNIQKIASLEACPSLRELWIAECHLTKIDGLQHCKHLEKLYLYCNAIDVIENLEGLTRLETLWLNNNQISFVEGLHTLQNLKELNLAGNLISTIGDCLDPNEELQTVNLSGNRLCSFKELTNLARLPNLKDLGLNDPQYSSNPVCRLCNYATHILYHMPHLQRLDTYDVDHKSIKDLAESTVLKKIIYYSMSVKTIQRQLSEKLDNLEEEKCKQQQLPKGQIKLLSFFIKSLERELEELRTTEKNGNNLPGFIIQDQSHPEEAIDGSGDHMKRIKDTTESTGFEKQICGKIKLLKERIQFWTTKLDETETLHQKEFTKHKESTDIMFQLLLTELETVGNIRFEEGTPSDAWFNSCCDLILSRFCALDFKAYGITGVKINRIIRVHNRSLRLKFDEKFQMFVNNEDEHFSENYRKMLEYLFCIFDPKLPTGKKELLKILEYGFQNTDSGKLNDKEEAVLLCNSLSLCEGSKIKNLQQQAEEDGKNISDCEPPRHGWLVVAKTFLGRCVKACDKRPIIQSNYLPANSVFRPRKSAQSSTSATKNDTCSSLELGKCDCSLRQCEWFVFDHELVLPEYVIELEYSTLGKSQYLFSTMTEINADEGNSDKEDSAMSCELNNDSAVINMEPVIKPKPKIICLDEKTVLSVTKASLHSQIEVLNLHGNGLNKLKDVSKFTWIQKLIISFNEFTSLEDVSYLPNLEYLDASHNRVITLEGFKGMGKLKHLDLSWNQLKKTKEEIHSLHKHAPNLLNLYLQNNPWHKPALVRLTVIGRLRTLISLDGVPITESEAAVALRLTSGSRITQGLLLLHSRTDQARPRCLTLLPAAQILTQVSKNKPDISDFNNSWFAKITTLNLDGQNLYKLSNLDKLENLRWASFSNNFLTKIEGLENCLNLEELALDENCITNLEGLSKLTKLMRLSVNNNQLTGLDRQVIDCLSHLHFLSAENNSITSLSGLQKAYTLIELYISNNRISSNQEIYHLKNLNNLVILDLHGNLISKIQDNYRLFVIFHLPALKALDGVIVDSAESENSKDMFGGRLTSDMVVEQLGHSNFSELHELIWTSSIIRTVDLVPVDQFRSVHTVNLEHNNLTSFSGLIYLPNIKILCLNHNHIESILPRLKAQNHLTNRQMLHQKVTSSGYGQQTAAKGARDASGAETLSPLMESLEVLHLNCNGISNLPQLQLGRLQNLRCLFLQGNEISQLEGLEGLQFLQKLVLDHNRIKMISETSLAKQRRLLELHLEENRLRELTNLQHLLQLKKLFLGFNKIQETAELDKLESLSSIVELTILGNPISRKMLHRPILVFRLPSLQILDGIPVTAEERARAEIHFIEQQMLPVTTGSLDVGLPSSTSVLTKPPPMRVTNVNLGGISHILGSDLVFPHPHDETLPNEANKQKRSKFQTVMGLINHPRSIHGEMAYRQLRGGPNISPTYIAQQSGSLRNAHIQANSQEHDGRLPNNGYSRPT
ncbi:leucine-rich repeat-containing protein 9 [Pleurodeles waltl]|uniref:leucine-rich repeat-containing protein 9 n=1 Tax=Pleurodeles waltl TaxID=8319 RepID=UPI003709B6A0